MKSPEYWQKRAEARMSRGIASADEVLSQLERAYAKAAREIQSEVRRLYERYGDEYGLSYADAIKDIEQSAYKEWRMTLADYVERINATGNAELLRELNTLSTRARVTRLQTLEAAVKVNASELAAKGETLVAQLLGDTYTDTYYRAAYDFQRGVGFGSSLEMLAPEQVAKAISYPWSGADYSTRIWKNADAFTATLQETITQGLIQGKDVRQMTAVVQDATGAGLYNAQRLVRTETAYAVESAELRSYADSDVEQYEVLVSLDERTCKKCGARDGEIHAVADAKTSVNYPPFHSNCRCTTIAHFTDEQLAEWEKIGEEYTGEQSEQSTRFARGADGKGVMLPGDLKYNDWVDKYVKGDPEYLAKMKAYQNRPVDAKQFNEYMGRLGTKYVPASLEKFQLLKYGNADEWGILQAQYRAMGYYDAAVRVEPEITRHVKGIAAEVGMQPAGLEYRVKSKESYLRKVRGDYKQVGNSFEINDILRYTYVASPEELVGKTFSSIERYTESGYNTVRIKNTWLDKANPYKGINSIVSAPSGQKFELQYHTQESFDLKNGEMHTLYEKWRVISNKASPEAVALMERMAGLSKALQIPLGIERIR
jgi:SPP1 gp7 family putative phage head morphogenesis protein